MPGPGDDSEKCGSPRPPGPVRDARTRNQLIPGRDPLACSTAARPTQSGPRRAASTGWGACGASRVRGAGRSGSAREHPGRPRRSPPPATATAAPGALGAPALQPVSATLPRPGSCRCLRLLLFLPLLLLLAEGGSEKSWASAPSAGRAGRAQHVPASGGRADAGDAQPGRPRSSGGGGIYK